MRKQNTPDLSMIGSSWCVMAGRGEWHVSRRRCGAKEVPEIYTVQLLLYISHLEHHCQKIHKAVYQHLSSVAVLHRKCCCIRPNSSLVRTPFPGGGGYHTFPSPARARPWTSDPPSSSDTGTYDPQQTWGEWAANSIVMVTHRWSLEWKGLVFNISGFYLIYLFKERCGTEPGGGWPVEATEQTYRTWV